MKILIVDDEPLVRKSLGRACRAKGHEVIEAADGNEGFNLWVSSDPDLVFLDVLMPGLSGPELLQKIGQKSLGREPADQNELELFHERSIRASVILMSAYSGEHNLATAQQMGAALFIPKPFEDIFAVVAKGEELGALRRASERI